MKMRTSCFQGVAYNDDDEIFYGCVRARVCVRVKDSAGVLRSLPWCDTDGVCVDITRYQEPTAEVQLQHTHHGEASQSDVATK